MNKRFPAEIWLIAGAAILLLGMLGSHSIWTQEYRWQQVCLQMLATKDYWHPYLDGKPYYDKPLLSYWLIILCAKINHGHLSNAVLRIPSVCAGFATLFCTYWLGKFYGNRQVAQRATAFLLTTFYFVFWARVASADMLNVAAILVAIVWFHGISLRRSLWGDSIFFLVLALGALLKGLIAPALVFLILIPHLWHEKYWKSFLNVKSFIAAAVGVTVYLVPFIISWITGPHYTENGLVEVFRENILRFFQPFDHQDPWWIYFIYLPIYTAPWILLVVFFSHSLRQKSYLVWSLVSIFIFLSLSGSRRSYYILPMAPFVMLWLARCWEKNFGENPRANAHLNAAMLIAYVILCAYFLGFQPYYYWHHPG